MRVKPFPVRRWPGALTFPRICDKRHWLPSVSEIKALPHFLSFLEYYCREGAEKSAKNIRSGWDTVYNWHGLSPQHPTTKPRKEDHQG